MATRVLVGVQDPTGRMRASYAEEEDALRLGCGSSGPHGQAGYVGYRACMSHWAWSYTKPHGEVWVEVVVWGVAPESL